MSKSSEGRDGQCTFVAYASVPIMKYSSTVPPGQTKSPGGEIVRRRKAQLGEDCADVPCTVL